MTALGQVMASRSIRRLLLAWMISNAAELAAFVGLSVYVFQAGGAALLGVLGVARLVPGALLNPVVTGWADRVGRERLLVATVLPRCLLFAAASAALLLAAPTWVVIVLAGVGSGLQQMFRPLQSAMMPWLARTPEELTAANGVSGIVQGAAVLVGPVIGAAVLTVGSIPALVGLSAVLLAVAAWLLLGVRPLAGMIPAQHPRHRVVRDWLLGFRALLGRWDSRAIAVPMMAQTFARGVLNVLVVVIAMDLFDLGPAAVGWLGAAMGLGSVLAGPAALLAVRGHRLARVLAVAITWWGLPLIGLGLAQAHYWAYPLFALVGAANVVEDLAGFTAIQRVLAPHLLGRALGALQFCFIAAMALGAAAAPWLVSTLGASGALIAVGAVLVAVSLAALVWLTRLDRRLAVPVAETAELRAVPFLSVLPIGTIEHLAARLGVEHHRPGGTVIRQGDPGETFYLITSGAADAYVNGQPVRRMGGGDFFGEISLLRRVARTATVTAVGELTVHTLDRVEFLAAVTGNPDSADGVAEVVTNRLRNDPRG